MTLKFTCFSVVLAANYSNAKIGMYIYIDVYAPKKYTEKSCVFFR